MSRLKSLRFIFIANAIVLFVDSLSLTMVFWGDFYPDYFNIKLTSIRPDAYEYFASNFFTYCSGILIAFISIFSVIKLLQMRSHIPRKSPLSRFFMFISLGIIFTEIPLVFRYLPFTYFAYISLPYELYTQMMTQLIIYILIFSFATVGIIFVILAWRNFSQYTNSKKKLVQSVKMFLVFAIIIIIISITSLISNIVEFVLVKIFVFNAVLAPFFNILHTLPVLHYLILSIMFGIGYLIVANRLQIIKNESLSDSVSAAGNTKIKKIHKNGLQQLFQISSSEKQQRTLEFPEEYFSKNNRELENMRNFFSSIFISISAIGILDSFSIFYSFWLEGPAYQEEVNLIEFHLNSNLIFRYYPSHFLISILNIIAAVTLIIAFFRLRFFLPKKSRMIKFLILFSLGMFFFHLVTISRVYPIFSYFYYNPSTENDLDVESIIHVAYFVSNIIGTLLNIFAWRNFTQSTKTYKKLFRSGITLQIFSYIACIASVLGLFGLFIESNFFGPVEFFGNSLIQDLYYIIPYTVLYFYPLGSIFVYSIGFLICGLNFISARFKSSSTIMDIPLEIFDFRFMRIEKTILYKFSRMIQSYGSKSSERHFCWKCGKKIDMTDDFCGYCGFSVKEKSGIGICPNCREEIFPEDKFCLHCGNLIKKKEN